MKKRLGMLALALCMAVIAVSGGALCTKASAVENNTPVVPKKIMIFSPHQDDEANIAEAIIYSNVKEGNEVYVVMGFGGNNYAGTNSDGTCNDSYGVRRLNESTKNLEKLGVQNPQDHIIYLGYHKVDYASAATGGIAKYNEKRELLRPNGQPYYTMGDGTEKYGQKYAWKSYHLTKHKEQCTVSEAHMQADIVDILKQYKPDEIYSIDFDSHIEHMYMGSVVDTAFGVLKQDPKFANYQPRFYESMSYQTAWAAAPDLETVLSPSDSSRKILESTIKISPRNKTLDWNDRVRFPVEKEMSIPDREKNLGYQAYKYGFGSTVGIDTTKPDTGDNYVLGCINGDQVVWERNTQSLSYQATVSVSSNPDQASQINDFSTLRMHMVDFKNFKSTALNYNDYKWSPAPEDTEKTVQLTFKTPQTVGMVKLFDDVSTKNQIISGVLSFSDGSTKNVGPLNDNGSATEVSFLPKNNIEWVKFKISTARGTPGLSEFEVYSAKSARPADFVKIYLDKVNGSKWATESFLYDYPMRVGETEQSVDLGVYRYPSETKDTGYTWSLADPPQGITLTQAGRLTVGTDATPGKYSITVTTESQPQLSDTITIDIANSVSIWPGKGTDADPYLISTQEQLAAITTGKSYKLMSNIALSGWASIQEPFAGTFNGNGYTISNLTAPLFKTVLPADAKAVTIKNVNLITTGDFAASVGAVGTVFAAIGNGNESAQITVDNVHATINGKVTTSGLVGECGEKNSVKINNCSVIVSTNGSIVDSNVGTSFAGGIIKHMRANTTIENSYVYIQFGGKITANLKNADGIQAGTHVGAGGIAATMPYAANSMTQIKNCYVINEGTIQSRKVDGTPVQGAGGLLGISYSNSNSVNGRGITNSYVYDSGTIQSVDGAGQKIADRQGCIYGYHNGEKGVPSVSGAYFNSTSAPAIGAANGNASPTAGTVECTLAEMKDATKLPLLQIDVTGSQWKSAAGRAPAGNQATTLQGLPYLLMENNAQFAPASLTYYKGGVDVTTTVTGGGALQSITKDGVTVDATNYSFIGSTLTIKKAYLGTLTVGKNVLKLTFAEGQPDRELEIEIVPRSGIDEAKQLIINGTYTFTQAAANTEADVKTALVTQISALPGMTATGVTVAAENITVADFAVAVAGTATTPNGTNGSFKFTVALSTGGSSGITTAKAETITATTYVPATQDKFALSFQITDGKTEYHAGETITAEIYLDYPGGTNIGSFGTTVGCDSTYLTLTGLTPETGVSAKLETGKVAIVAGGDATDPGFAIAAAGTKLATATFTVKSDFLDSGSAKLTFTESHVSELNGTLYAPDAITATNTTINVVKQDDTASGVSVTGRVTSYNPKNATTVELKLAGVVKYTATIPAGSTSGQTTQNFTIENVAPGTYELVVTKAGHLTYTITNVVVAEAALDLTANSNAAISTITLLAGDMNGDGKINVGDLNIVWNDANYDKVTNETQWKLTDIDGNGKVNVSDLNIVWNDANYDRQRESDCIIKY